MTLQRVLVVFVTAVVAGVSADDLNLGFEPYDRQCGNTVCKGPMQYCDFPVAPKEHPTCFNCINYCSHVKSEIPQGCTEYCALKNDEVMFVEKHKAILAEAKASFQQREKSRNETVRLQKERIKQEMAHSTNLEMEKTVLIFVLSLTSIIIIALVIVIVVLCLRMKAVKSKCYKQLETSSKSTLNSDESIEMIKNDGQRGASLNFHTNIENNHKNKNNRANNAKFVFSNHSREYLPNKDEQPGVGTPVNIEQDTDDNSI